MPVVRYDAKAGESSLDVMRWGLVPFRAKDIKVGFANINAKAEGVEGKPAFRETFQRRRCLVPVDNFYEWKKTATGKQPQAIAVRGNRLMALAGLWESWRSPMGERVLSFAIITTTPNEICSELHDRMPVVLKPEAWLAALARRGACRPRRAQVTSRTISLRGHDVLASQRAGGQRQEQRPEPDRADYRRGFLEPGRKRLICTYRARTPNRQGTSVIKPSFAVSPLQPVRWSWRASP